MVYMKSNMENSLHCIDNPIMTKIEYCSPTINNERKMKFRKFEMKTNENVRVVWSKFNLYTTKGPIKVDAKLERSTNNILKVMKHYEPSVGDGISCLI